MGKINFKGLLLLIVRLLVASVFIAAALPKIENPVEFAAAIEGYRAVPDSWSLWIAIALPWLELVCALGLMIPQIRRASAVIIAALLVTFIGLHLSAWFRGLDINCGCFGLDDTATPNYALPILRNSALLIGTICILIHDTWNQSKKRTLL